MPESYTLSQTASNVDHAITKLLSPVNDLEAGVIYTDTDFVTSGAIKKALDDQSALIQILKDRITALEES